MPKKSQEQEPTQEAIALDHPVVTAKGEGTQTGLRAWLPSGVSINVPRYEVLMLRDLCNSYMAKFGATDYRGREVVDWHRPHPAVDFEDAPTASDTEPSNTERPDAGR